MSRSTLPFPYSIKRHGVSLSNCDDEPVQTPGCIQAHGLLLALSPDDLIVRQASENWPQRTGLAMEQVLDQPLAAVIGPQAVQCIVQAMRTEVLERNALYVLTAPLPHAPCRDIAMDFSVHQADGVLIVEIEPASRPGDTVVTDSDYYSMVKTTLVRLKSASSLSAFCDIAANEVRRTTGLDRVMIYRFHRDETGEVIADAHRSDLNSWLGLRYPASDIPVPARAIFKRIGVRPLPDVDGALMEIVPLLNPVTGRPLDMTYCALRGASVMYTDYLRNMGVAATLTMPILRDGRLWGLIACHHYAPIVLPYTLRAAAEFLGQVTSLEIASAEGREHLEYRLKLEAAHHAVLGQALADGNYAALTHGAPSLLDGIDAGGVAVSENGHWSMAGATPDAQQLTALAAWLTLHSARLADGGTVIALDDLGRAYPEGGDALGCCSGLLAFPISQRSQGDWVIWFRPEQLQTYRWGGNPYEAGKATGEHGTRLTPRQSFAVWQEEVRGRAEPWKPVEIEAAKNLRLLMLDVVVARAEQLAALNTDLVRSNDELDAFAYVAGHDLKEPLRGIHKYAHFLLEETKAGRPLDAHGRERIDAMLRLTVRMDSLLDALLHFSRVGRLSLARQPIALGDVVAEATDMLGASLLGRDIDVQIPRPLPTISCDRIRVREVFANLISNAAKYNDKLQRRIEIGYLDPADGADAVSTFYVRDNGIGIDAKHSERVFMMFKRLHTRDAYGGGSGAGLAIVKKLVEQHNGHSWFTSEVGVGTTFYFTLIGAGMKQSGA
ncbi:GAF domain-containing protein [Oxalobacteraceae sp. CFBP 8761]|nr:GAF domain-containing protein [Oxalobacteraceae sp. CFBP 8761]MBD8628767.1 GAF domain-containing protein [Oxalobacteraceae sp. CFBP 8753]